MNDDDHETRDEYEDRKEQHEAASEIEAEALRASCTHQRVFYRPVGGNAEGWKPVWVCERCCTEFVPESQVNMALRATKQTEEVDHEWHGVRAACWRDGDEDF
jgi:hypothetical protein